VPRWTEEEAMTEKPVIQPRRKGRTGTQTMLIPSLAMIEAQIAALPKGAVADLVVIRKALADEYGSDACCPVTTQRHVRTIAEREVAAIEHGARSDRLVPFWRVVDPAKPAAKFLAGGATFIRERRAAER
jgi:hypothetical protein